MTEKSILEQLRNGEADIDVSTYQDTIEKIQEKLNSTQFRKDALEFLVFLTSTKPMRVKHGKQGEYLRPRTVRQYMRKYILMARDDDAEFFSYNDDLEKMTNSMNWYLDVKNKSTLVRAAMSYYLIFKEETKRKEQMKHGSKEFSERERYYEDLITPPSKSSTAEERARELRKKNKILSYEQIQELIDNAASTVIQAALSLLYDTGCRRSELLSITVDDVVLEIKNSGNIQLRREDVLQGIAGGARIEGKGGKYRNVWFHKQSRNYIKQLVEERELEDDDTLIEFVKSNGEPYSKQGDKLYNEIRELGHDILGEEYNVTPHVFRHSRATHLIQQGEPVYSVKEYLGHESIATTQTYIHIGDEEAKKALSRS